MKTLLILIMTIFFCCVPEMPEFERIKNEKQRVLAVIFSPGPEIAPGDTVRAKAYFAGKQTAGVDNYRVSYSRTANDSFANQSSLNIIKEKHWFPDSLEISFTVPESLLIRSKNKMGITSDAIRAVHDASKDSGGCLLLEDAFGKDNTTRVIDALFEESALLFTVHSEDGTTLKVQSRFLVRYSSRFKDCVSVNTNPEPSKVFLYTVADDSVKYFNPNSSAFQGKYTSKLIYNPEHNSGIAETIQVNKGYSYFLGADSVKADIYTNNLGTDKNEIVKYSYFYETDDKMENLDSILTKESPVSPIAELRISEITKPSLVTIWLVTHDDCSDAIRSSGFAISKMCVFVKP